MSYIDIIILLFLLWGAFRGFSRGLIIGIATLAGLVLGVYGAIRYSVYVEGILHDFLHISSQYLAYIALAITFLIVVIIVYWMGRLLTKLVDCISLGLLNKLLGMLFGIMKYLVLVCVILMIVDAIDARFHFLSEETKQKSVLFYPFLKFAQEIYNSIRF